MDEKPRTSCDLQVPLDAHHGTQPAAAPQPSWRRLSRRALLTSALLPQDTYPPPASVNALAWAPNGCYIASGGSDHTVQVWRPG